MRFILLICLLYLGGTLNAQVDPQLFLNLNKANSVERNNIPTDQLTQGMVVMDTTDKKIYFFDGEKWVAILDNSSKIIVENELFFQDANYCYISMLINTSSYRVVRYDKLDINAEAVAVAVGNQPVSLSDCQSLTYN